MGRIRRDCDPCRNDWKEKINQLWNNYQDVVKSITLNGTRKTPDGQGNVDLGTVETEVEWGDIEGTLADQTDLQDALDAKADACDLADKLDEPETAGTAGQVLKLNADLEPVWADESGGGSVDWGDIGGTLADQTDLANALADKADSSSLATVATTGDYDDLTDKPNLSDVIRNTTTNEGAIGILGTLNGPNSRYSIAIGKYAYIENYVQGAIAIGLNASITSNSASYAIQLGRGANPDAGTFNVGLGQNINYRLLDVDGTIPEDRLADTTGASENYVLSLDSNLGAVWRKVREPTTTTMSNMAQLMNKMLYTSSIGDKIALTNIEGSNSVSGNAGCSIQNALLQYIGGNKWVVSGGYYTEDSDPATYKVEYIKPTTENTYTWEFHGRDASGTDTILAKLYLVSTFTTVYYHTAR